MVNLAMRAAFLVEVLLDVRFVITDFFIGLLNFFTDFLNCLFVVFFTVLLRIDLFLAVRSFMLILVTRFVLGLSALLLKMTFLAATGLAIIFSLNLPSFCTILPVLIALFSAIFMLAACAEPTLKLTAMYFAILWAVEPFFSPSPAIALHSMASYGSFRFIAVFLAATLRTIVKFELLLSWLFLRQGESKVATGMSEHGLRSVFYKDSLVNYHYLNVT